MKIDGDKPSAPTGQADPAERPDRTANQSSGAGTTVTPSARSDQIQLSPDVQLVRRAVEAATQTPTVRREAVERMRALLAQGDVGTDASRLANAIIETWLNSL